MLLKEKNRNRHRLFMLFGKKSIVLGITFNKKCKYSFKYIGIVMQYTDDLKEFKNTKITSNNHK